MSNVVPECANNLSDNRPNTSPTARTWSRSTKGMTAFELRMAALSKKSAQGMSQCSPVETPTITSSTILPFDTRAPTTELHQTVERHSEFFFDDTLIENTLFNIHKYQLLESEAFSSMFKVPNIGQSERGSSPEHPIKMEGVKASDFAALLRVLYTRQWSTHQLEPSAFLIIPAFRLADMWGFSDLRTYLLPLAEKHLCDIDKILFAREFNIEDWLAPAHVRLCQRREPLSTEEARKLGVDSLLLIARLGQQSSSKGIRTLDRGYYCSGCSGFYSADSGKSETCAACQNTTYMPAFYDGKVGVTLSQTNPTLETKVQRWVQDGFVFKD